LPDVAAGNGCRPSAGRSQRLPDGGTAAPRRPRMPAKRHQVGCISPRLGRNSDAFDRIWTAKRVQELAKRGRIQWTWPRLGRKKGWNAEQKYPIIGRWVRRPGGAWRVPPRAYGRPPRCSSREKAPLRSPAVEPAPGRWDRGRVARANTP